MKLFGKLFKKDNSKEVSEHSLLELGFGEEILAILNQAAADGLHPLRNYEETTIGLSFSLPKREAEQAVEELRFRILHRGYFLFISDVEFGRKNNSRIGVVKTDNQFQVLKTLKTNGENYDISNEEVIMKLQEWHQRTPFTITGANFDWVELTFESLPANPKLKALAKEIEAFCPDAVEFEEDDVNMEETVKSMEETKKIFLWWD